MPRHAGTIQVQKGLGASSTHLTRSRRTLPAEIGSVKTYRRQEGCDKPPEAWMARRLVVRSSIAALWWSAGHGRGRGGEGAGSYGGGGWYLLVLVLLLQLLLLLLFDGGHGQSVLAQQLLQQYLCCRRRRRCGRSMVWKCSE